MNIAFDKSIYDGYNPLPPDITGWHFDSTVFENLILETNPKLIVEVGTWKGASAIAMANIVKKHNMPCKIICIDTWLGALEFWHGLNSTAERNLLCKNGYPQVYYQFLSNVVHSKHTDIILPFPNTSSIGGRLLQKEKMSADLIYVDASHDFEDVLNDINTFLPVLRSGGIMFGDDYHVFPGVREAVNQALCNDHEVFENNFWIHRKK